MVKLYSSDVGLLTSQYGNAFILQILSQNEMINLGGVFENVVAQELNAHGFKAFFYNSHKQGELDFLIEKQNLVVPIEVKSGKERATSLISAMKKNRNISYAYKFIDGNIGVSEDGIITLPLYMATFI